LLGAQVIAEYERPQDGDTATLGELKTDLHASKWDDRWSLAPAMCRRAKAARAMTLIADPRRRLSISLDGFIVLYAILYSSFGVASSFLPTFIQARGIAPEHEPSMSGRV
jgi:hypothetical protein